LSKTKVEAIKNWFSRTAEEELEDDISRDDIVASIAIVMCCVLMVLYFGAHQMWSTGFFTATFGTVEMFLLYGSLIYWIVTSTLILIGRKHPSRDFDTYGGLQFATISIAWLIMVFPFEFAHFADVLPNFLRFLVQWISNGIARVLMVLGFIVHLAFTVVSVIMRVYVRKARVQKS
jgi:hypothetical protein